MVSIIIPVYNGERYIDRCLGAILPALRETEVIAVNDGSEDASLEKLRQYAQTYPNLLVIDKRQNEGLPQAKKTGLTVAKGDYVAFLDVDDWAEPELYAAMEGKARESRADLVFCDFKEELPDRTKEKRSRLRRGTSLPISGKEALRYVHKRSAVFQYPWNKLYRAELLRRIEFPTGNFVGEDYYVTLRFLLMAERVDYLPFAGYHYVTVPGSMSRGGYGPNTALAYERYREDLHLITQVYPHERAATCDYLITEYLAFVIAMGRNDTYDQAMIREIKQFVREHLLHYLCSDSVSLKMKGSALTLLLGEKFLVRLYRMIKQS